MKNKEVNCNGFKISNNSKISLIAGPCQLETEQHAMDMAGKIKEIASKFNIGFIYKTSFDKANRTSLKGKRGAGIENSLPIFDKIKKDLKVPVLTDIHNEQQCKIVSEHVDILQIPAFLCRQTDLLIAAAKTNKIINVKKGQFLAPWDMINVTKKISDSGNENILVTERGASFGYNTLVSDMRSLPIMAKNGYPVVLMELIQYNNQEDKDTKAEGKENLLNIYLELQLLLVLLLFFWKHIKTRITHHQTDQTWYH